MVPVDPDPQFYFDHKHNYATWIDVEFEWK